MSARTYCADHCVDLNPRDLSSHASCRVVTEAATVRRGNWTYVHTRYDGPRWQLDGTTLQLEHDPSNRMGCSPNGMWDLYRPPRFVAHIDGYLAGAMEYVEEHLAEFIPADAS